MSGSWDPTALYFNQFDDLGLAASVLGAEWEIYDANPGNAGNGVRAPGQVEVVAEASSTSGNGQVLRITAEEGAGGVHLHGGVKLLIPRTYMQAELRVRCSDDATVTIPPDPDGPGVTSGVVIFWPTADPVRFPDSNNTTGTEGEWPAGGELDFWESFDDRDTRTPVRSFIHRLNPAATPPYDPATDDEVVVNLQHYNTPGDAGSGGIDQSDWHKIVCSWTPDEVYIEIDNGPKRVITSDPASIPDWDMELTLQLDAWSDTAPSSPVTMDIDYVLLRSWVPPEPEPLSFPDVALDMAIEMAFEPASTDPASSTWTDVTDRLEAQSFSLTKGRSDESSQTRPSAVSFQLNNNDGALTPNNAASPFHPNVHRGIPVRISADGTRTALALPGTTGAYASTPDAAALDITGDLDVRVRLQPDRWATSGSIQRLVNKWATNDLSYGLALFDAGTLIADWSTDGTTGLVQFGTRTAAALQPIWLAQAIDVDDGAGGHNVSWYRFDGATPPDSLAGWDLIESFDRAGTTSIHAGAGALEIGSRLGGTEAVFRGSVLAVQVRDGIDGTVVANPDFTAQTAGTTTFTDDAGLEWTIHGDAEITARTIRFVGTVDAISLDWPYGDHNAASTEPSESIARITAAGILRRLSQGEKPLQSSLYRHITSTAFSSALLGYWPCEDGDRAVHLASGLAGGDEVLSINEAVDTANDDSLPAAGPLPNIASSEVGEWTGIVPVAGPSDEWAVELFFKIPTPETSPTRTQLFEVATAGTGARWIVAVSATDLNLRVEDGGAGVLLDNNSGVSGLADTWVLLRLQAAQNGGNIDWAWSVVDVDTGSAGGQAGSIAGTNGRPTSISNMVTGPSGGMSFGHIVVHDNTLGAGWMAGADSAWVGESAAHRFRRLCSEEGIEAEVIGDPTAHLGLRGDLTYSEPMGPQGRDSLLNLIRQCVDLESGFLLERRRSPGLVFRTRSSLEAQAVGLALDGATYGEIDHPFRPVLDDQRLRNDITITSVGGSSARAVDQDSIDAEGLYEVDVSIAGVGGLDIQNAILDTQTGLTEAVAGQNLHQAQRRLALAASSDLRYPSVSFDLGTATHLIEGFVDLELGDRVTVVNLPEQHPLAAVELLLEHITERVSPFNWRPQLTCSPGTHWLSPWPPITAATGGPLNVVGVNAAVGVDPQSVTNPIQGTGHDLIAIAAATGPSNEAIPPAAWVPPTGSSQVLDYPGVAFVSRARVWTFTEDGAASYSFGFDTAGGNPCTCILIGLDGTAAIVFASTVLAPGGVTSNPYPQLATQVDDLVVPVAISQVGDEMTAGPAGYTEEFDNSGTQDPRGVAVHSGRAVGSITTPGNSTWDASAGAHIQFVLGARGSGSGGTGNTPIPANEWTVYIDPTNPDSYGPNRSDGQLISVGETYNADGTICSNNNGDGQICFDAFTEIHSFQMEDGDTLRLGARDTAGLFNTTKALRLKHQFRNSDGYVFQPTVLNTSTAFPGTDRLFVDGTRTQYAQIPVNAADPKAIRASYGGATGDRVLQASLFRIEPWMLANNLAVAGGGSHASGVAQSPWTHFFGKGQFELFTRETDSGLAWPSSGTTPWSTTTRHIETITASDVGNWWAIVSDYIIDPLDGHLHVWLAKGSAGFTQIVGLDGGSPAERWGLSYADTDPNQDLWYVQLANYYAFRNTTASVATNNHDDSIGNVRTIEYGNSGVFVDPATRTAADLQTHCNYFLQG
ncbi:MAG: glycoside hydrolase family 16 protein [Actinomycetota bacterium]